MTSTMTRVAAADIASGDTSKHVKYTFGMLLGVDDFTQEFTYLSARDRWLARDLIGYGTVWGLSVEVEKQQEGGWRVNVDRGVALSPLGERICVPAMQCAYLEPWLVKHQEELAAALADDQDATTATVPVRAVLCYRSQDTDRVPIPGEPCRSEDELTAPSRVQDGFELELQLAATAQVEETAIRDFAALVRQIEVVDDATIESDPEAFVTALRTAAKPAEGESPEHVFAGWSDPQPVIPAAGLVDYLRAAFRLWVTEIRPRYRLDVGCGADECPPSDADGCVLLAEIDLPLKKEAAASGRWFLPPDLAADDVALKQERRPYVVHERMLQEWMFGAGGSPATSPVPDPGDGGGSQPGPGTGTAVVAAGRAVEADVVDLTTTPGFSWGGLTVTRADGLYLLGIPNFIRGDRYVVTGTPIRKHGDAVRFFELVADTEIDALKLDGDAGIYVRLTSASAEGEPIQGDFVVEISKFPEPG